MIINIVGVIFGLFVGFFLGRLTIKKKEAELEKVVELMYSRNIDRTLRNLKDKEFEETANGNEDKL